MFGEFNEATQLKTSITKNSIKFSDLAVQMRPHRIAYLRLLGRPYTLLYVRRSVGRLTINPLSARIFTTFGHSLLEDRVLHKEAWVAKLLGTHLSIQVHKKVLFSRRDNSSLAVKGL